MMRVRLVPLLLASGAASLLVAMWAGLFRSGLPVPQPADHFPLAHGPLMISGFLGTVIGLEKARGLGPWWAYLAPALSVAGALSMIGAADPRAYLWAFLAASLVLSVVAAALARRHLDAASLLILAGAAAWAVGNLVWMSGGSIPNAVSWWIAFPVLIILGERLELTRVLPRSKAAQIELAIEIGIYSVGLGLTFQALDLALRLQGIAMALIAFWLLRNDLARRTSRAEGVYKYTAVCLLCGFVWLAVAGGMLGIWGADLGELRYDLVLHAILLGFVFGMIFGHAPIIAPMLLGRHLSFSRAMYAPVILLQASLLIRITGSLAGWLPGRTLGATLNVVAILLFLITTATAFRHGRRIEG
jgi:hypothetical protein